MRAPACSADTPCPTLHRRVGGVLGRACDEAISMLIRSETPHCTHEVPAAKRSGNGCKCCFARLARRVAAEAR